MPTTSRPRLHRLAPLLSALLLVACSGISVSIDHDQEVDFSRFQTYAWIDSSDRTEEELANFSEGLTLQRIQGAVDRELAASGLRLVPETEADLLVRKHFSVEESYRVMDPYFSFETVRVYQEGTLAIEFRDAQTRRVLWHGSAHSGLRKESSPEQREKRVEEAVAKLLAGFPPKGR